MRILVAAAALAACTAKPVSTVPAPPPSTVETPVAPAEPAAPAKDYPDTRRDNVVDTIHGVQVADPYRWLEDPTKPDVAAWMKAQDDYARGHIAKLPHRDNIVARLREVYYFDALSAPIRRKDRYFFARKHKDKEKRIVYWKTGETGAEKVLLDPNTWSTDNSAGLRGWTPSWDGQHVAYTVSEHNADEATMKVLDVTNGKLLTDTIAGTRFTSASWTPDGKAFYYTWTPPASESIKEADRNAHAEVRIHRLGTDPAKDAMVYPATGHSDWFVSSNITEDGHFLFTSISHGSSGGTSWFYKDVRSRRERLDHPRRRQRCADQRRRIQGQVLRPYQRRRGEVPRPGRRSEEAGARRLERDRRRVGRDAAGFFRRRRPARAVVLAQRRERARGPRARRQARSQGRSATSRKRERVHRSPG